MVTYLGCIFDETLSGESMALNVLKKGNNRLKFLYRKNRFLTKSLRRLLCNAIVQPNLDYACSSWYPTLTKKLKDKLQSLQNKCIKFCLQLSYGDEINRRNLIEMNWLNVSDRVDLCHIASVHKFIHKKCPSYMNDIFTYALQRGVRTRRSFLRLHTPLRSTNMGKNCISYCGPSLWNNLENYLKGVINLNSFKHKYKDKILN